MNCNWTSTHRPYSSDVETKTLARLSPSVILALCVINLKNLKKPSHWVDAYQSSQEPSGQLYIYQTEFKFKSIGSQRNSAYLWHERALGYSWKKGIYNCTFSTRSSGIGINISRWAFSWLAFDALRYESRRRKSVGFRWGKYKEQERTPEQTNDTYHHQPEMGWRKREIDDLGWDVYGPLWKININGCGWNDETRRSCVPVTNESGDVSLKGDRNFRGKWTEESNVYIRLVFGQVPLAPFLLEHSSNHRKRPRPLRHWWELVIQRR